MSGKVIGGLDTNNKEADEAEDTKVEVEIPYYTANMDLIINTRECVVPQETMSLTDSKMHQNIK